MSFHGNEPLPGADKTNPEVLSAHDSTVVSISRSNSDSDFDFDSDLDSSASSSSPQPLRSSSGPDLLARARDNLSGSAYAPVVDPQVQLTRSLSMFTQVYDAILGGVKSRSVAAARPVHLSSPQLVHASSPATEADSAATQQQLAHQLTTINLFQKLSSASKDVAMAAIKLTQQQDAILEIVDKATGSQYATFLLDTDRFLDTIIDHMRTIRKHLERHMLDNTGSALDEHAAEVIARSLESCSKTCVELYGEAIALYQALLKRRLEIKDGRRADIAIAALQGTLTASLTLLAGFAEANGHPHSAVVSAVTAGSTALDTIKKLSSAFLYDSESVEKLEQLNAAFSKIVAALRGVERGLHTSLRKLTMEDTADLVVALTKVGESAGSGAEAVVEAQGLLAMQTRGVSSKV